MQIVALIFERITALDVVGPYEVLSRLPDARVTFAGVKPGLIRTDDNQLGLQVDAALESIEHCDVLLIPGGYGTRILQRDPRMIAAIQRLDQRTRITASVCTGALLLAAAGLLRGRRATTHFAVRDYLSEYGAIPVTERIVADGKYRTAAGVSAGIDLAFALAVELCGETTAQAIQLGLEYAPEPPLHAGREDLAPPEVVARVKERVRRRDAEAQQAQPSTSAIV